MLRRRSLVPIAFVDGNFMCNVTPDDVRILLHVAMFVVSCGDDIHYLLLNLRTNCVPDV